MRVRDEGLKSEALKGALKKAVGGQTEALEDLMCRYGGGSDPRPNYRLAAAFGVEVAALANVPLKLLNSLSLDDSDPETPRVFLSIAAAHAWAALVRGGKHVEEAWAALGLLAADERAPVRLATLDALATILAHKGGALELVQHATLWLLEGDHDARFSAAAMALEALGGKQAISALNARPELLEYLGRAIAEIAEAPRSAERLDGRRRLLVSLPRTLAAVVSTPDPAGRNLSWMEAQCADAKEPDVRATLSDAILLLRKHGQGPVVIERLRGVMNKSAKPLRDPSRLRPGTGRGKLSRKMR
jgi:hypothetical protein